MPILPRVGRRSPKIRLVIAAIYLALIGGAITMVYPFLIMLSGSVKGQGDIDDMDPWPAFFHSDQLRFARFMEDRYGTLTNVGMAYGKEVLRFREAPIPPASARDTARFRRFLGAEAKRFPAAFRLVAESTNIQSIQQRNFRRFRDRLRAACPTIEEFDARYRLPLTSWNDYPGVLDNPPTREFNYEQSPLYDSYLRFKAGLPLDDLPCVNVDGLYQLAQARMPAVKSGKWPADPVLAASRPAGARGEMWEEFVRHQLNCLFVRLDEPGRQAFVQWLLARFGSLEAMNRVLETRYAGPSAIRLEEAELRNGGLFTLYSQFVAGPCPANRVRVDSPSTRYRAYVGSETATMPVVGYDYDVYSRTRTAWMWESISRNYRNVVAYITIYGRAVVNTIVLITLTVLAALIVNPLAAYALSRFRLRNTYGILMFFLVTMALPGAVTMIPNFLLLKQLHLLNSFWALILPGLANGFSIFILKGFFDSIPQEMYESAMLDGAGEWTMFWRFTMALSTPVLALIGLGAFTSAYSAFMFALIICPDEKMWTLMVWLYQLQITAHQSVVFAALVLAALPTFLIFVFAQRIIMQGIVVPIEK